jgi:hypothetical protein
MHSGVTRTTESVATHCGELGNGMLNERSRQRCSSTLSIPARPRSAYLFVPVASSKNLKRQRYGRGDADSDKRPSDRLPLLGAQPISEQ